LIAFFKFTLIASQDQTPVLELSDSEVPAYVLFQSGPLADLTEFMEDYIESNRILNRYSSNFYYHPFCTASYSDTLQLHLQLVRPPHRSVDCQQHVFVRRPGKVRKRSCVIQV
jgi:hypothetical protein